MAYIDFPTSPTTNQVYTFGGRSWLFNGKAWQLITVVPQGATGFTGSRGETGYVGSASIVPGPLGYTGSQGAGFTGSQGDIGPTGYTGSIGYTGSQGAGFTGSQGTTGYVGSRGGAGAPGYTGSIGYTGSAGAQGVNGFTGSAGAQGVNGFTGSQGYTGSIGVTGPQGNIGYTGSAGVMGGLGYTGSAGAGFTGSAGATGYTGSQGSTTLDVTTIAGTDLGTVASVHNGVSTLRFDTDAGFDLTSLGDGSVKVGMNSTFKYITVDGQPMLTAVGLDTLRLIAGDNISLVTDNAANPQSITISATSSGGASVSIGTTPPTTPAAGDMWWNSESGTLKIYYNDGDTSQWVDATPSGIPGPAGDGFKTYTGADNTIYVATTGNDATADGSVTYPFNTIQAALDYSAQFMWASAPIIQVQSGSYGPFKLPLITSTTGQPLRGIVRGVPTDVSSVLVTSTSSAAATITPGSYWHVEHMTLTGSVQAVTSERANLRISNLALRTTGTSNWWTGTVISAFDGGTLIIGGPITILNTSCFSVMTAYRGGCITATTPATITMQSPLTISNAFAHATVSGILELANLSYAGAAVTGAKYNIIYNSTLMLWGTVLPGSVAGVTSSGGQVAT